MGEIAAIMASAGSNALGTASSTYSQATAQKSAASYEKNQLQFNAQVADLQGKDAIIRGNKEAANKKRQTKQLIGTQRAALAAQGIDVNEDDSVLIQQDTAGLGAEDVQTIKNNAWREAWGYKVENSDLSAQAKFAGIAGKFKSNQTILTGGLAFARDISGGAKDYQKYKNGKD